MSHEIDRYPVKNQDIAHRVLGDEAMVANLSQSSFYNLNPAGTFIWKHCDGHHTLGQIGAALATEYDLEGDTAIQDCRQFIEELVEEGLLSWIKSPRAQCGGAD
jgi:hypothetical protein